MIRPKRRKSRGGRNAEKFRRRIQNVTAHLEPEGNGDIPDVRVSLRFQVDDFPERAAPRGDVRVSLKDRHVFGRRDFDRLIGIRDVIFANRGCQRERVTDPAWREGDFHASILGGGSPVFGS